MGEGREAYTIRESIYYSLIKTRGFIFNFLCHSLSGHALSGHALSGHALSGHALSGHALSDHALSHDAKCPHFTFTDIRRAITPSSHVRRVIHDFDIIGLWCGRKIDRGHG